MMARGRRPDFAANSLAVWQSFILKIEGNPQLSVRSAARIVERDFRRTGEWNLSAERLRKLFESFDKRLAREAELSTYALASLDVLRSEIARQREKYPDAVAIPRRMK